MWPEEPVSRLEKSTQHLTPNHWTAYNTLYYYRAFGCFMMWIQLIFVTTSDFIFYGRPQASYFSLFGIYLGTLVYTLLFISHCKHPRNPPQNVYDDSIWILWKWCCFLIVLHFHWQFLITTTYWLILYWDTKEDL